MNRRSFLTGLLGTASAMVLDDDRLLWRPGRTTYSIPAPAKPVVGEAFFWLRPPPSHYCIGPGDIFESRGWKWVSITTLNLQLSMDGEVAQFTCVTKRREHDLSLP